MILSISTIFYVFCILCNLSSMRQRKKGDHKAGSELSIAGGIFGIIGGIIALVWAVQSL